jgi:hypothetical protein
MATTKYIVDNASDQTIDGNLNITGTTNIKPYKVYTALLSQFGGDSPQTFAWEYLDPTPIVPELLAGVSYYIDSNNSDTDFTISGSPSNNNGTHFVANGTQPDWQPPFEIEGSYIQIEWNLGAPVVTVLENTIGNIWFTYDFVGDYSARSVNAFTVDKTYVSSQLNNNSNAYNTEVQLQDPLSDSIRLLAKDENWNQIDLDGFGIILEIRVYN